MSICVLTLQLKAKHEAERKEENEGGAAGSRQGPPQKGSSQSNEPVCRSCLLFLQLKAAKAAVKRRPRQRWCQSGPPSHLRSGSCLQLKAKKQAPQKLASKRRLAKASPGGRGRPAAVAAAKDEVEEEEEGEEEQVDEVNIRITFNKLERALKVDTCSPP